MQRVAWLCFSIMLAACGGGGGGSIGPVSPPPPPVSAGTLAITAENAESIALVLSLSEGALAVAQAAINTTIEFAGAAGASSQDCGNVGTVAVSYQDNDSSLNISAGDVVTLTFTDCYNDVLDATANGIVEIVVSSFELSANIARVAGDLITLGTLVLTDATDPAFAASISTSMGIEFALESPEVLTIRASSAQRFSLQIGGTAETISNFVISKLATRFAPGSSAQNVDTEVSINLRYDSEFYGGTVTCESTDLRFDGNNFDNALAAEVLCRGLANSGVRITIQRDVEIDPEGDGSFAPLGILDWGVVLDGFMRTDSGLVLNDLVGEINTLRITMNTNDVIYDKLRDRLLIATTSSDPRYPNAIVELSLTNNGIRSILNYTEEPHRVRIAEDGSVFYVGFSGMSEIRPYDAESLQALPTISITSDQPFSSEYGVLDLEVSPVDPNVIAVAFQFLGTGSTDVTLFDGTTQFLNSYRDVSSNVARNFDAIEISSDGSRLFAGIERSTGGAILEIDATGVVGSGTVRAGFSAPMTRVDNKLYSGRVAYDEETLVRLGTYQSSPFATGVDADNNLVFIPQSGDLAVFRQDSYVPIANYDLGLEDGTALRTVVSAGDTVVLGDDSDLYLIDVADIEVLNTVECEVVNLLTDQQEPYINYNCPIFDAVYDSARDRIYAAVDSRIGVNGNSIVVIDNSTSSVLSYLPIGSEPRAIDMSSDGNRLYVTYGGADIVTTVDLNTLLPIRVQQIETAASGGTVPTIEPFSALDVIASTIENDTFILSIGEATSSPFHRLTAYRDGVRLPDEVLKNDLENSPSNSGPHVVFDDSGQVYSLTDNVQGSVVQMLMLGPIGLSTGPFFVAGGTRVGTIQPEIFQNEVFTGLGSVIDLAGSTGETRYDIIALTFAGNLRIAAVNADVASNNVYLFADADLPGSGIGRYDYLTGSVLAEQTLDINISPTYREIDMFDVADTHLGIKTGFLNGLVVIDKDHIQ